MYIHTHARAHIYVHVYIIYKKEARKRSLVTPYKPQKKIGKKYTEKFKSENKLLLLCIILRQQEGRTALPTLV